MYSGNLIRTTHLTGTSTDIGLLIGSILRGNVTQLWKLQLLLGLAGAFWFGGLISFYSTREFASRALLFSATLFFSIGIALVIFLVKTLGISLLQAATGEWGWQEAMDLILEETRPEGGAVTPAHLMQVFDKIDDDGNGYIEEKELYSTLRDWGLAKLSKRKVKAMISVADSNDDGLISRDEWRCFWEKTCATPELSQHLSMPSVSM